MPNNNYKYDVALSFAGEDRAYVKQVYECLKKNKISVFYDEDQDLWGIDMLIEFAKVFNEESRYVIPFISKHYKEKIWTKHEIRNALAKALNEENEYILPVRFDDTHIPGILPTIKFEDAKKLLPEELCEKILAKLGKKKENINSISDEDDIELPKIKKRFTDLDRSKFLKASFKTIREYFDKALRKLNSNEENVETELEIISDTKFVSKIYIHGDLKNSCKLWVDSGSFTRNSISYFEGTNLEIYKDGALNDYATIEDDGSELFFKISGMSYINDYTVNKEKASAKEVAKYFWKRFIQHVN